MVGAQPLQRVGEEVLHRARAGVVADEGAPGVPLAAELDLNEHAVAGHSAQGIAQQHLVMAHAVEIAGVQQRDPAGQRRADGRDALRVVSRPVDAGHGHQPESGPRDQRAAAAERNFLHQCS